MELEGLLTFASMVAITVGLTQVLKGFVTDERYHPLFSVFTGAVIGVVNAAWITTDVTIAGGAVLGVIVGLSAAGLYDHKSLLTSRK